MKKIYISVIFIVTFCFGITNVGKAATYFFVGTSGSQITDLHAWNSNSLASVSATLTAANPASFTITNTEWKFATSTPLSLAATWSLPSATNVTVTIGDGTNPLNFTIASGGVIGSAAQGSAPKITLSNSATLTANTSILFINGGRTVFNAGSTVIYGTGSGPTIPLFTAAYSNLIINTAVTLSGAGGFTTNNDLTVNAVLTLNGSQVNVSGNLILSSNISLSTGQMVLNGAISGSGTFIGDNLGSVITLNGTGNVGTLNMASPFELSSLSLNLATGVSSVSLGTDLIIDGGNAILTSGILNLNGHAFKVENTSGVSFAGATIGGSSSSAMHIEATSISGSLTMDATNNTLKYLYLNSTGNLLTLANNLNITDSVSVGDGTLGSGGKLTLVATSSLKGRIGRMGSGGVITGNITAQVFAPGGTTGWAQLCSGGVSGETIASWDGQFPMTCTGCTYDPSTIGGFYSIQGYVEANSSSAPNTTAYDITVTSATALTPTEGFWVYLGTGQTSTSDITIINTGSPVIGAQSTTVTNSDIALDPTIDGWNLIGNPYASPISFDKLVNANAGSMESGLYIWSADDGVHPSNGNSSGYIIPAGQGFFVHAPEFITNSGIPATYTITFDESMKTIDNTGADPLLRTAQQTSISIPGFVLNIAGENGDKAGTTFQFNSDATMDFDNHYDFHAMFSTPGYMGTGAVYNQYTSISSVFGKHKFAKNTMPVLTSSISVPVLARVSTTGTYSISLSDVTDFSGCTILKDNLTGQFHDLATGAYVCTIADTTSAPRFELVLCQMATVTGVKQLNESIGSIQVIQGNDGPAVITHFPVNTKATISVFNVVGQKLINDQTVEGKDTNTQLHLDSHNEVLLIKVSTPNETVTKKIITH